MGLLRLILALAVVIAHSTKTLFGFEFIHAAVSVQAFYVISGFYMSLILNEKYIGKGSYQLFLTNRFLRLFPTYWVVLALSLLVSWLAMTQGNEGVIQNSIELYPKIGTGPTLLCVLSNLFIFGQDLFLYLGFDIDSRALFLTTNFLSVSPRLQSLIVIPQAWSLSLELMFYVLAPFIVRKRLGTVGLIIALSLCCRAWLYAHGLDFDPWTYRFFPNELALFVSGTISYRILLWVKSACLPTYVLVGFGLTPITATLAFPFIAYGNLGWVKVFSYLSILVASLPFLFHLTGNIKFDRFIGELSYPVYLIHIALISFLSTTLGHWVGFETWHGLIACSASVLLSALIYLILIRPLEIYRGRRIKRSTEQSLTQ